MLNSGGTGITRQYDVTKSLKLDYTGRATALIGEPTGVIDRNDTESYARPDTVRANIENFGEVTSYDHQFRRLPVAAGQVPADRLYHRGHRYQSTYRWDPRCRTASTRPGQPQHHVERCGQFKKLYDKVPI